MESIERIKESIERMKSNYIVVSPEASITQLHPHFYSSEENLSTIKKIKKSTNDDGQDRERMTKIKLLDL